MPTAQQQVKDAVGRVVTAFHKTVHAVSGGRLGSNMFGMPVVMLTTTGRKSGMERTTPLTSPLREGDTIVLVASWGGDDRHPQWYRNLQENPKVKATIDNRTRDYIARTATDAEKAGLWPKVVASYKGYGDYQTRTSREIPLVLLDPA